MTATASKPHKRNAELSQHLVNSANLHKAWHLKKSQSLPDMHAGMLQMIEDVLQRGAKAGVFRRTTHSDALQLVISIAALGYYYLTNCYTMAVIFGFDPMSPQALVQRRDSIKQTVLASLQATVQAT